MNGFKLFNWHIKLRKYEYLFTRRHGKHLNRYGNLVTIKANDFRYSLVVICHYDRRRINCWDTMSKCSCSCFSACQFCWLVCFLSCCGDCWYSKFFRSSFTADFNHLISKRRCCSTMPELCTLFVLCFPLLPSSHILCTIFFFRYCFVFSALLTVYSLFVFVLQPFCLFARVFACFIRPSCVSAWSFRRE